MAVHDLSGGGVIPLTSGVTHLFVEVLVFGPGYSTGTAVPTNYYRLGLLRIGWHGAYRPIIPIDATDMIIDCPALADTLGYSLDTTTSIRVTEDFT